MIMRRSALDYNLLIYNIPRIGIGKIGKVGKIVKIGKRKRIYGTPSS